MQGKCRVPEKDQSIQCKLPRMGVPELTAQRTDREEVMCQSSKRLEQAEGKLQGLF